MMSHQTTIKALIECEEEKLLNSLYLSKWDCINNLRTLQMNNENLAQNCCSGAINRIRAKLVEHRKNTIFFNFEKRNNDKKDN